MSTAEITIKVDASVAEAYRSASEEDRRRMDVWASIQLAQFLRARVSLKDAMKALSDEAARNGMTPEILESILREEE